MVIGTTVITRATHGNNPEGKLEFDRKTESDGRGKTSTEKRMFSFFVSVQFSAGYCFFVIYRLSVRVDMLSTVVFVNSNS